MSDLRTPESVWKLQTALYAKAKGEPEFRFYALYDKVYRDDVLGYAYECCRRNKGAAGVDGQRIEDIEAYGRKKWLGELANELRERRYRPEAVRRVYIPKPNGRQRPLGIPTLRDRVSQTAAVIVLEAIFEADLTPEQHGYRRGKDAKGAVEEVQRLLNRDRHLEVVDADLSGYFDTIPHAELMKSVSRRIVDGAMLHLIKMWLEAPVEEAGVDGRKVRTTVGRDARKGIPQGGPASPLLSNVYMRRFILSWKKFGCERRYGARIVNYADDLVICCRHSGREALLAMRHLMLKLKLTINEEKTRVCRMPEEKFDFLGYTFSRLYSMKTGKAYIGTRPSRKSIRRLTEEIHKQTSRENGWREAGEMVLRLNRKLRGWSNYFRSGAVSKAYRYVDKYTTSRLRRWLCRKHKVEGPGIKRYPDRLFYGKTATHSTGQAAAELPVGEGMKFRPRAGCVKRARPGSMSGMRKRSPLGHRAASRLYSFRFR